VHPQPEQESIFRTVFAGRVSFGGIFRRSLGATTKKGRQLFWQGKVHPQTKFWLRLCIERPMSEGLDKCWCAFLFALRLGRPCNSRPTNVYQRFDYVRYYFKVQRHLHHPSPNFYRGPRSAIFGLIVQRVSTLSRCCSETCLCHFLT